LKSLTPRTNLTIERNWKTIETMMNWNFGTNWNLMIENLNYWIVTNSMNCQTRSPKRMNLKQNSIASYCWSLKQTMIYWTPSLARN